MSKRQKFVATSFLLALVFLLLQFTSLSFRYEVILAATLVSLVLSLWSLREGLGRNPTLLTVILPAFFTLGSGLFYFNMILSSSFYEITAKFVHLPLGFIQVTGGVFYWLIYSVGIYAAMLGANIYNIASIRTIALLRTAHAVGFLLTVATALFLFSTLLAFRGYPWINALSGIIAFPLVLQNLWSIELEEKISREVFAFSVAASLIIGEIALVISIWPVTVLAGALTLTASMYVLLGITQASLQGRLFEKTLKEYLFVGLVVFIAIYFSARWGG